MSQDLSLQAASKRTAVFEPLVQIGAWFRSLIPKFNKWPELDFIWLHHGYIISMSLLGSILIYPAGGLRYIDALFFASGAATQSGLNTVDFNNLLLYQQVVIHLLTFLCTPIFIHGFLVFVRLYWFEKRFQGLVQDARKLRATRSFSRSRARNENDEERDAERLNGGVNGCKITVMRSDNGEASNGSADKPSSKTEKESDSDGHSRSDDHDEAISPSSAVEGYPSFHRDILFADESPRAARRMSNSERLPPQRPPSEHIAFVEKQRNQNDKETLRIPGPRDFDLGHKPENVGNGDELDKPMSRGNDEISPITNLDAPAQRTTHLNWDDNVVNRRTATHESESPARSKLKTGLSALASPFRRNLKGDHSVIEGLRQRRSRSFTTAATTRSVDRDPMPYLSWQPTIGRNSVFIDLTEEQREELGGVEYRALKTLAFVLVLFYVGFHLLGVVSMLPWIIQTNSYHQVLNQNAANYAWWGIFTPASMFNDLGFTLTADSMISFQGAVWPLLMGSFLIIIGNTGFPCMLRFVIWLAHKLVPKDSAVWEELKFLLDHPRRCFTLLFPSDATWWLFWVLVFLNGADLVLFIILDINDDTVTSLRPGVRVLVGWFQAASTRTAGFAAVNLALLHPAVQVSYLIMMYISVFPIAISLRRTNVYEEQSLGIYRDDREEANEGKSYVSQHLRHQLSFDLPYVFIGFFLIAIIEGGRLEDNTQDPRNIYFSLFAVLFEIVSAYGTVGLSLGFPDSNASFSAQFRTLSKLVIIFMQIRGRHRGLPYSLDRAVLLPGDGLNKKEEEMNQLRRQRSNLSEMAVAEGIDTTGPGSPTHTRRMTGALPRRGSAATMDRERDRGGLKRLLSGALSAGPTLPKERAKNA